jgi:hypothetical protein
MVTATHTHRHTHTQWPFTKLQCKMHWFLQLGSWDLGRGQEHTSWMPIVLRVVSGPGHMRNNMNETLHQKPQAHRERHYSHIHKDAPSERHWELWGGPALQEAGCETVQWEMQGRCTCGTKMTYTPWASITVTRDDVDASGHQSPLQQVLQEGQMFLTQKETNSKQDLQNWQDGNVYSPKCKTGQLQLV